MCKAWWLLLVVLLLVHEDACLGFVQRAIHRLTAARRVSAGTLCATSPDGGEKSAAKGFGKPKSTTPNKELISTTPSAEEGEEASTQLFQQSGASSSTVKPRKSFENSFESTTYFKTEKAKRERELDEKIAKLREEEALMAADPSVGAVPELIADRMLGRIVTFFGVPVFGGLAIFVGAYFYFKKYDLVIQPAMIAYATQVPFVLGLLGITYGILSSSWDKEPGSALGFKEFKTNIQRVRDGLTRTKDTATLRDEIERESDRLGRGGKY